MKAYWTSNSDEYSTPQVLFDNLDAEFHFNLDPCSTDENAKCEKHYTKADNGLSKSWGGCRVFCNPPYSRIAEWVEKCYREGTKDNTIVVPLIPSRTDTRYFHNFINHRAEIRFIKGRLKFGENANSAPFPSMIVIFRGAVTSNARMKGGDDDDKGRSTHKVNNEERRTYAQIYGQGRRSAHDGNRSAQA